MSKTIVITGASSGIGKATAKYFAENGWNVVATMRKPENEKELGKLENVKLYALDVTDKAQVESAIAQIKNDFGQIDVLLNNAGYGLIGPIELADEEQIYKQFETNVFGCLRTIKAVLPTMKEQKKGLILNVTSIGGVITMPLASLYHGTKFAMEGISQSINYELNPLNIRVATIAPGGVSTDFSGRSMDFTVSADKSVAGYEKIVEAMNNFLNRGEERASTSEDIAKAIFEAANSETPKVRYILGSDAAQYYGMHRQMEIEEVQNVTKQFFGLA
ncbi:MAG: SDR family oxidoreductase [Pyrinomonadaceae bacterium]|nr:SDR family oxidoreductase [Pyrinomonadaceae bacterium]